MAAAPATPRPARRLLPTLLAALGLSLIGNVGAAIVFSNVMIRQSAPEPEPVVVELIEEAAPQPRTAEPIAAAPQPPRLGPEMPPLLGPPLPPPLGPELPPEPAPEPERERPPEPAAAQPPEPEAPTLVAVIEEPPPPFPEPAPEPPPEAEVAPEPEPPAEPPPPQHERAQSVAQENSNDEESLDAEYLAERANRVEVQTVAEITSLDSPSATPELVAANEAPDAPLGDGGESTVAAVEADEPENEPPRTRDPQPELVAAAVREPEAPREAQPAEPPREAAPAQSAVEPVEATVANEPPEESSGTDLGEQALDGGDQDLPEPGVFAPLTLREVMRAAAEGRTGSDAITAIAAPTAQAYEETFGTRDRIDAQRLQAEARAGAMGGDHQQRWDRTRAALENFDVLVEPGTETGLNTRSDAYAGYIHILHNAIHPHWSAFINHLDFNQGPGGPLGDMNIEVTVEFAIGPDGVINEVRIRRTSGHIEFDAEAIDVIHRISPQRSPPEVMRSPDGQTYVRWEMHRNAQMCHSSGASIHVLAGD